jgi:hypothetical protein
MTQVSSTHPGIQQRMVQITGTTTADANIAVQNSLELRSAILTKTALD